MKYKKFLFLHPLPPIQREFFIYRRGIVGINQGLGILAQMALNKRHQVKVLPYYRIEKLNQVINENYDWIFVTTFTNQYPLICKSLKLIESKKLKSRVVLGGVHASFAPNSFRKYPYDILVRGEGEIFLDKLLKNENIDNLPGVYFKGQKIKDDLTPIVHDLDKLPAPMRYLNPKACAYRLEILGTRGCLFKCPYCVNSTFKEIYPQYWRRRSPESIIKEIVNSEKGYKNILFLDDDIFTDQEWLAELLKLYHRKIKKPYIIKSRPLMVNQEFLSLIKSTGCMRLNMGIEHGNYKTRKNLFGRNETDEQIIDAFRMARSIGLQTTSFNMLGLPDDTEQDINDLIELNRKCQPSLVYYSLFQPYPGTKMSDYAKRKGIRYKFPDTYFCWKKKQLSLMPNLPGVSREKLIYYFQNFSRLAKVKSPYTIKLRMAIKKYFYNADSKRN